MLGPQQWIRHKKLKTLYRVVGISKLSTPRKQLFILRKGNGSLSYISLSDLVSGDWEAED